MKILKETLSGKPYTSANVQCKLHAHTCFLASTESRYEATSFGNTLTMITCYSALYSAHLSLISIDNCVQELDSDFESCTIVAKSSGT